MSLHALIAEMRERAALQPYNDMALLAIRWADKLESALAGGGEAVAWRAANHPRGPFALRKTEPTGWSVIEPLYLHHAGSVQVTEVPRTCTVCNGSDSAGWGHGCEPGGCSTAPARDERDLFKEHFKHFDCTEQRDAWGNRQFIHEHVESIFFGWKERASLNPGGSRE